jgi:hypothetical protein
MANVDMDLMLLAITYRPTLIEKQIPTVWRLYQSAPEPSLAQLEALRPFQALHGVMNLRRHPAAAEILEDERQIIHLTPPASQIG